MEEPADLNDPDTWLELADQRLEAVKSLIENGFYDDAVARAYYAMYYAAKAVLLSVGIAVRKHSSTVALFTEHFIQSGRIEKHYVTLLGRAQRARERSDYAPSTPVKKSEADQIWQDAQAFLSRMQKVVVENRRDL